ncbi:DUF7829 domain-containing protein [Flavobacterium soyangense]|uniref:DUF7829 domain-containing protein n=1 Tax=Flavobacterium soyangense TaxID=2023265 RepID=A0A930UDB8_9FLAO|nr:hypothetical protein [Flavobacterium soyangense]MBF2709314.1 hypothetical protein [Flavobacterium soyangense]
MDHWKKQSIDSFLIEIENYFLDCSADSFQNQSIINKVNKEELQYLLDRLDLAKIVGVSHKLILNETLKNKEKNKFSYFILRSKNIPLEVNHLDETKKSVFIRLAENYFEEKNNFLIYSISELFDRGYVVKEEDELFTKQLFKKIQSESDFEKWSMLRFAVKLNDSEKFTLAYQKQRELFVILSLKLNKPISFNFPNLLGVLNNAIQHYRESGDIILKATQVYKQFNEIIKLDARKGNFAKKLNEYHLNKPIQNKKFEEIVKLLFAELS